MTQKTYTKYNLTESQLEEIVNIGVRNFDPDFDYGVEHQDNGNFDDSYEYGVETGVQDISTMINDIAKEGGKL